MTATITSTAPVPRQDKPIVFERDGHACADSRQVAAYFGKTHRDVLRAIDNIQQMAACAPLRNFAQGHYTHPSTGDQQHRFIMMDRDGFMLVAMGFSGKRALAWKLDYIAAFNAMERELSARKQVSSYDIDAANAISDSRALLRVASIVLASPQWHDEQAIKDIGLVVDLANNGLGLPENVLNEI